MPIGLGESVKGGVGGLWKQTIILPALSVGEGRKAVDGVGSVHFIQYPKNFRVQHKVLAVHCSR